MRSMKLLVLLVVLVGSTACTAVVDGSPRPVDVLVYERPGLPPPGPAVGDGGGLVSRAGGRPVTYGGVPVVQACELLTPEDVAGLGLQVRSGTLAGVVRLSHLDDDGEIEPYPIGATAPNTCTYGIDPALGSIDIAVHQPSYSGAEALGRNLRWNYGPPVEMRGVQVHQRLRAVEEVMTPWLRVGDVHVELYIDLPDDLARRVLDHLLARLPTVAAAPAGPITFGYDSPAMPRPHVDACAISDWSDAQGLAGGAGPSAQVQEHLATGAGRIFYDRGLESNYVDHNCQRRAAGDALRPATLTVRTMTFDNPAAPAASMAFTRGFHTAPDTTRLVGEESLLITFGGATWVEFRRGPVVVEVEFFTDEAEPSSEQLLSAAAAIDARIPR